MASSDVRQIVRALERIGAGDYQALSLKELSPELAPIGVAFNQMADQLSRNLSSLQVRSIHDLGALLKNTPGLMCQFLMRPDGSSTMPFLVPEGLKVLDLTQDEYLADQNIVIKLVHADDLAGLIQAIQESAKNLTEFNWRGRIVTKRGIQKWFRIHSSPERLADGSTLWHGIMLDVSQEEELRATINKNRHELEQFLAGVPALIGHWDKNLINVNSNQAYSDYFQMKPDELRGRHIRDLLGPELYQANLPYMQKVLKGEPQQFEREIKMKNGTVRSVLAHYWPHILDGQVAGFFVFVMDIGEIKVRENLIIEQKKLTDAILENLPVAVFLKDESKNFAVTLWNKAAEQIFRIPREKILGKTAHDLWPKEFADKYLADDQKVMREGVMIDVEEESVTEGGPKQVLRTRKLPFFGAGHNSGTLLAICDDITDQVNARKQLIQSSKMSSLGEMAGGIAHEINNPLTIISGKASHMRGELERGTIHPESLKAGLKKIEDTVVRIAKIISGLRSFSRSSESDPFSKVRISKIVDDTLELCSEKFKHHQIDLRAKVIVDVELECRPAQISQVLMNLLSNAFDAVEKHSEKWVELKVEALPQHVRISVTDSGPGVPLAIRNRIMQPFFTTKDVGHGTGLGLSISKGIIESHHGTLILDEHSERTRFVVDLPLVATS